ncbi:MAG TPA: class 1 fructose-bisphosphatase [Actinomycetes bacterium]|nr:class 1 fructose-bisphosphatase [Actinomycetes bacterium]
MTAVLADPADLGSVLSGWSAGHPDARAVADVVSALAGAGADLAEIVAAGPLTDLAPTGGTSNASGDEQKPLDLLAEAHLVAALRGLDVAAVCSEESEEPIPLTPSGSLVVTLDPVDGSSNLDINAPIGTIFSVLPTAGSAGILAAVLQPGRNQLAAGVIVYGPSTVLLLTLGEGTDVFVLNPSTRSFVRTRAGVQVPADSREYAINASNARHWDAGIRSYVADLVDGSVGPRGRDFNMRWLGALVAETYRILLRGGIFLYPRDDRPDFSHGRIRLVYEANPVAFLCEQAGGLASDGVDPILDKRPTSLHQRTPFVFGSRTKVERVRRYVTDPSRTHEDSPLFSRRGLFRTREGA